MKKKILYYALLTLPLLGKGYSMSMPNMPMSNMPGGYGGSQYMGTNPGMNGMPNQMGMTGQGMTESWTCSCTPSSMGGMSPMGMPGQMSMMPPQMNNMMAPTAYGPPPMGMPGQMGMPGGYGMPPYAGTGMPGGHGMPPYGNNSTNSNAAATAGAFLGGAVRGAFSPQRQY